MLFIQRDAEKNELEKRLTEIKTFLQDTEHPLPTVCVVPVRMTEAWLLAIGIAENEQC